MIGFNRICRVSGSLRVLSSTERFLIVYECIRQQTDCTCQSSDEHIDVLSRDTDVMTSDDVQHVEAVLRGACFHFGDLSPVPQSGDVTSLIIRWPCNYYRVHVF